MAQQSVILTLPQCLAVIARVDTALGYPKAGADVGGGVHVDAGASQTNHHFWWRKHPALAQWAIPYFPALAAHIQAVTGVAPVAVDLDATWDDQGG